MNTEKERKGHIWEYDKTKGYRAKAKIKQGFKNHFAKEQIIELTSEGGNCSPLYELGESYLLFLIKKQNNKFKEIACTHWGKESESKKTIRIINKLSKQGKRKR